jgi:dipeptidase E
MKIIALGGGEIGRPGFPVETTEIDMEIVRLSAKKNPKVLFIPTASSDSAGYVSVVHEHFGTRLGCEVNELCLLNQVLTKQEIEAKVFAADVIYVGGGNTLKMMNVWRRTGLISILSEAGKRGIVLSGISAGAICWFASGSSDSRRFTNPKADLIKVTGLGFVPALFCPHYDVEVDRKEDVKKLMRKTAGVAVAVENCCAIEIVDNTFRVISSKKTANAYKVFWTNGIYREVKLEKLDQLQPLSHLLSKVS